MRRSAIAAKIPRGFTLVELLVVIAIIGVLIAMLLPAVNAVRESGRRTACSDNIHNLALACLNHEATYRYLPTGGWGPNWLGDGDQGTTWKQPGGWIYNILPYNDQQNLHDQGSLMVNSTLTPATKLTAQTFAAQQPIPNMYCPTRRNASAYAYTALPSSGTVYNASGLTAGVLVGKTDYAMNGGDGWSTAGMPSSPKVPTTITGVTQGFMPDFLYNTGVSYAQSQIQLAQIKDGVSNTYLLGEKWMDPDHYLDGMDGGDTQSWDQGYYYDSYRWTGSAYLATQSTSYAFTNNIKPIPPNIDSRLLLAPPGTFLQNAFGSAHVVFLMGFCDGSVKSLNFDINPTTHQELGNRSDYQVIDSTQIAQ